MTYSPIFVKLPLTLFRERLKTKALWITPKGMFELLDQPYRTVFLN
jgi:hypothetical protein